MAAQGLRHSSANLMEMNVQGRLDKVANSTHPGYPMRGSETCGTENDSSTAWVKVEKTGVITFSNFQGDNSTYTLDNGLKHGSRWTASDLGSSAKSPSTKSSSTKLSSTESSYTEASSSLITRKTSPSISESSSTKTAPTPDCSAAW
ncbi:hypothetical protein PENANT_c067G02891 [Penicillium antarcticum]|uniref:Uncharacterized protein n=1 Tax=Penicillium antarcticum TaxID=416450 RepID=A0A1V6PPR6_9EURO|nr:uncharacterized protein N7508_007390 [Penicillium antarcticum]XP_058317905.1 uncharacterized protein N7508_007439 [Penicillium antarcticum]KAJ5300147.1 hypothetical protein N7508_007390 [Penicillium antarcticum]KAJ5300196.1 hypothetical protein N7508_007439 [Penicillium antarcticum]OQD78999.1 hypothetical protein PENANT_c067G02891 [Penicillium antarcticum]